MLFRLRDTGQVCEETEFRQLRPELADVEILTEALANANGADVVTVNAQPVVNPLCRVIGEIVMTDEGKWIKRWRVEQITDPDELARLQTEIEKQLTKECKDAVQKLLDTEAQKRDYDNIQSAALRAGYPGPFHGEGVRYASWMDACWAKCYEILAQVKAGERGLPTVDAVISEMPEFTSFIVPE